MKKFELTNETTMINGFGTKHYRIRALKDFGRISAGDLGGFVEKESNLSHDGFAWIYNNAIASGDSLVSGDAHVYGDAILFDKAIVSGSAYISDHAVICNKARIDGHASINESAIVEGSATVSESAKVTARARVSGDARILEKAEISGWAIVSDTAKISGNARIAGHATVKDNAWIHGKSNLYQCQLVGGNANISGDDDWLTILGLEKDMATAYCRGGLTLVRGGDPQWGLDNLTFFKQSNQQIGFKTERVSGCINEFEELMMSLSDDKARTKYSKLIEFIKIHLN